MKCLFYLLISILWVLMMGGMSAPSFAQQTPSPSPPASLGTTAGVTRDPRTGSVKWFPFSADEISVTTRTLADGTKITSKYLNKVYGDSEGRTRQESIGRLGESGEPIAQPGMVLIRDPIAGFSYILHPWNHTAESAVRSCPPLMIRPPATAALASPTPSPSAPPKPVVEDLGSQVMEGLNVHGTRTTQTIPAGAEGNDHAITVTSEFWGSPELNEWVMSRSSDPRSGETVIHLTHLVRQEQPAALFQVPPDYTVVGCRPLESAQPPQPGSAGPTAGGEQVPSRRGVIGFPYTAEEVTATTQTLADGTKITSHELTRRYQDSQGRTRRESFGTQMGSAQPPNSPWGVMIFDPAAGVYYTLNPRDHAALKSEEFHQVVPPSRQTTAASPNPTPRPPAPPRPTIEDLGAKMMDGIEVSGSRTTTTIPAGAEGNDHPLQIIRETWYSPDLRLTMMDATNDPRKGETVMRVTELSRDEPPADLFRVPADYTIEEQVVAKPASSSN